MDSTDQVLDTAQHVLDALPAGMEDILGLGDVLGGLRRGTYRQNIAAVEQAALYFILVSSVLPKDSTEHHTALALVHAMATLRFRLKGDAERARVACTKLDAELALVREGR